MDLKGKNILVTGGSSGIGLGTAQMLIGKGANVGITARGGERLQKAAELSGAFPIQADVSNPEDIKKTMDSFLAEFGSIDALVNNAGIGGNFETLENVSLEDFHKVFGINVYGAALMAQAAIPHFKAQNKGAIVNIASTAALKGFQRGTVYSASKFALRSMTQCWQAELRPHNIRVILVNPSEVVTDFFPPRPRSEEEIAKKLSPKEIAHAIVTSLEMEDKGFIPEVTVWATNPF